MTKCRIGIAVLIAAIICAAAFSVKPASARTQSISHGGTYFGNVVVGQDQRIEGPVTAWGSVLVDGGEIDGDVTSYGGDIEKVNGGIINGQEKPLGAGWTSWVPFAPSATIAAQNRKLMTRLAYSVIVLLAFLIFPIRVRKAMDRIEHHPGLSAATGVMTLIAVVPVAIVLLVSVIGLPLIPVEFVAIFAGILIGQAALGILLGRRLFELVVPHSTPSPLAALIIGLAILSAAEILPAVGTLVTVLVCLLGLGAAVLAFVRETAFMTPGLAAPGPGFPGPGPSQGPRPPIGGPPMPAR